MSPWQRLGIEPTDDSRAIRRAYAKQLKITRPDDQPAEFQALHEAYKGLLAGLAARQTAAEGEQTAARAEAAEPVPRAPAAVDVAAKRREADTERERQLRLEALAVAVAKVRAHVQRPEALNDAASWAFLARTPFLLDDDFNQTLGAEVARELAPKLDDQTLVYTIGEAVLHYLDQLFSWARHLRFLAHTLPQSDYDVLRRRLHQLDDQQAPGPLILGGRVVDGRRPVADGNRVPQLNEYLLAGMLLRGLAFLLDAFLVFIVLCLVYVPFQANEEAAQFTAVLLTVPGYLLLAWFMESSPVQATPAKAMLNFRVTNKRFQRLGYVHGLWRVIAFLLSCALWKVGWFINLFLFSYLIHDRLSGTYVLDVGNSREPEVMEKMRAAGGKHLRRRP